MTRTSKSQHTEKQDPHWIEWLTGIVSAILVAAILGWIGFEAITRGSEPPALSIRIAGQTEINGLFRVSFEIGNSAPTTAAAVTVVGELRQGERVVETAEVQFDYVPAESQAEGALFFANDPRANALSIRPTGFTDP